MSERFFSSVPITAEQATLEGPEAHHLMHVMRATVGQSVTLFDDSGAEFTAVVERLQRSAVTLRVVERREVDRELPFSLEVGVALPKGDRQKWLVEKLTELGATTLVPLETRRGVAQPTDSTRERLERAAIEAAKQCGRNRLMRIASPQSWDVWVSQNSGNERRLIAHPGGTPLADARLSPTRATRIAVGPEGGFTEDEIAAAITANWQTIDLGPRILRIETASLALAAAASLLAAN